MSINGAMNGFIRRREVSANPRKLHAQLRLLDDVNSNWQIR